jgi:hypothetical protein
MAGMAMAVLLCMGMDTTTDMAACMATAMDGATGTTVMIGAAGVMTAVDGAAMTTTVGGVATIGAAGAANIVDGAMDTGMGMMTSW